MKRLLILLWRDYKFHLLIAALGVIAASVATAYGTLFISTLIDDYIMPMIKISSEDFSALFQALMIIANIYLIGIVASYVYSRIMVTVSQGTMNKVRQNLFQHMQSLPVSYFDTHAHGDVMSIYTNDTDTLRQFLSQSILQLAEGFTSLISVFFSMLILNIPLTLVSMLMVALLLLISRGIIGNTRKYFAERQEKIGALNGYVEEMMTGQKVIKVFNHEEQAIKNFESYNEALRLSNQNANSFANIIMPISAQIGNLSYVICAVVGAALAINGYAGVTIGVIIAFLSFNRRFNNTIGRVSQQINAVVMAMAGVDRIFKFLDESPEDDEGYVTLVNVKRHEDELVETAKHTNKWAWKHYHKADDTTSYVPLEGNIVLEDVDFGYSDDKLVLKNINLYANAGQKIALVGSTGAGKTTITNLINRFYDITNGKIRYDGINVNKIKKQDLRRSLGLVLQETHLFTGTIMDNIRFGRIDASDEACIAAAKRVNADSFISRLPNSYHTEITGDGANLSQGQRQLLSIARAAVADPPVLILDEATSSIDTRTEVLVQRGMDELMKDRTTFVIAHRLSTIKNSDLIVVLEDGKILEKGTHDELMAAEGKYFSLNGAVAK